MSKTNAIERLREYVNRSVIPAASDASPTALGAMDALADVDALYQAAAKVLDLDYGYEAGHPAWDALAAAVRRVEAEA